MPWCPKCKIEYVDGMTVCNDCGTELVDELPEELVAFMETEKEKLAQKFVQFLNYSRIDSATYDYDEEKKQWRVLVKEDSVKQVKKLYNAFYTVELSQQLSEITEDNVSGDGPFEETEEDSSAYTDSEDETIYDDISDDEDDPMFSKEELQEILESTNKKPVKSSAYVKKEEQFRDLKSTAYTFLLVSVLGIAVLILNAVGIIHIVNGILPYIVMGALFVIFLGVGFQSFSCAKKVEAEIEEENRITETIQSWLSQNVSAELLDSLTNEEDTEEIRFFNKLEKMKELIVAQFGEMDDSYLDFLVEEYYNDNFEH